MASQVKGRRAKVKGGVWFAVLLLAAACAPKAPPAAPGALRYPDFVKPVVPQALTASPAAARVERGWNLLQADNLRDAEREFTEALRRDSALYPAQAGSAYVALARREATRARALFDLALTRAPDYLPAMAGRGQALVSLGLDQEALATFEAALKIDPDQAEVRRRLDAVRFRLVQSQIEAGRAAAAAGRFDEAKAALNRALAGSPESALVHRELGLVERGQGNVTAAIAQFRLATMFDPFDTVSYVQMGELHEQRGDFGAAEGAFRAANAIDPSPQLAARIEAVVARGRDSRLPAEFQAIAGAAQITRADLAALIGVRLESEVRGAPGTADVLTDIRGHWATRWIPEVARAGFVAAFENHTFQPATRLRRVDLATSVSRVLTHLARTRPALRSTLAQRPAIADVPQGHLNYPQMSAAIAAGVLPLNGDRFDLARPVSGQEAIQAVERLVALAGR